MAGAIVIAGLEDEPFEYFCRECRQLRLCCAGTLERCGRCGAPAGRCVVGKVGDLDKEALLAEQGND